jgi:hypothetical protein
MICIVWRAIGQSISSQPLSRLIIKIKHIEFSRKAEKLPQTSVSLPFEWECRVHFQHLCTYACEHSSTNIHKFRHPKLFPGWATSIYFRFYTTVSRPPQLIRYSKSEGHKSGGHLRVWRSECTCAWSAEDWSCAVRSRACCLAFSAWASTHCLSLTPNLHKIRTRLPIQYDSTADGDYHSII